MPEAFDSIHMASLGPDELWREEYEDVPRDVYGGNSPIAVAYWYKNDGYEGYGGLVAIMPNGNVWLRELGHNSECGPEDNGSEWETFASKGDAVANLRKRMETVFFDDWVVPIIEYLERLDVEDNR